MITAGTKKAKVTNAGYYESKEGKLSITLTFGFDEGELTWYGGMSTPEGRSFTNKTLIKVFSWNGDADGIYSLIGMDADIVVEFREYNGKQQPRVKYINPPGGASDVGLLSREEAKLKFAAVNNKADYLEAKRNVGETGHRNLKSGSDFAEDEAAPF